MERNDSVIYRGRRYVIDGFDPMSVEPRRVYLHDPKTGQERTCLYEELLGELPGDSGWTDGPGGSRSAQQRSSGSVRQVGPPSPFESSAPS
jgi:hypothetical protein